MRWTTLSVGLCRVECEMFARAATASSRPDEVVGGFFCDFECSLSTRSEWPRNRKKDHARPALPRTPSPRRIKDAEHARVELGLLVVEHHVHEVLGLHLRRVDVAEVVAAALQLLGDGEDRPEDVEVRGRADVALVRGKREDRDGELLVLVFFPLEGAPLEGALGEGGDAVVERDTFTGGALSPGVDDGLDGAVKFR